MPDRSQRYATAIAACLFVAIGLAACFNRYADPYWIWRETPPWQYSPGMELRMRFAKLLQVVERRPGLILVGSSTVYRGLDPALLAPDYRAYNLGISSLRIREAEAYIAHALRQAPVRVVVLGLDFFMFDSIRTVEEGFDPRLGKGDYLVRSRLAAVAGRDALDDAYSVVRHPREDPDGSWQRNGFKRTFPRSAAAITEALQPQREFYEAINVAPDGLEPLARIARACRERGVVLKLYITPTHQKFLEVLHAAGKADEFKSWRESVASLARAHGVELWDFSGASRFAASPLDGSNPHFMDTTHFSPVLGAELMHEMRLQLAPQGASLIGAASPSEELPRQ